jgi:cell division protein YceG involved in septum cleavage
MDQTSKEMDINPSFKNKNANLVFQSVLLLLYVIALLLLVKMLGLFAEESDPYNQVNNIVNFEKNKNLKLILNIILVTIVGLATVTQFKRVLDSKKSS